MNTLLNEIENLTTAVLLNDKYRIQVHTNSHVLMADEPEENGGEGTAPDPYELLSASLSTCTLATLHKYLKQKDWDIKLLSVAVSFTEESKGGIKTAHFLKQIKITGTLTEIQKSRLLLISDACPVSKILKSGSNKINSVILS